MTHARNHLKIQLQVHDEVLALGFIDFGFEHIGPNGSVCWWAIEERNSKKTGLPIKRCITWIAFAGRDSDESHHYMNDEQYARNIIEQLSLAKACRKQ